MPENAALYQERGRIRLLNGDKEGSIEDMKKVIELNTESEQKMKGKFDNQGNIGGADNPASIY